MTIGPLMIDVGGTELTAEDRELLAHPLVGAVILFSRNFADRAQVTELNRQIRAACSNDVLIAVDQEGGRVQRFDAGFTELPPLRIIGHQYDADPAAGRNLAMLHARIMATELLDTGVDFSFAPVVDIDRGLCEVIGDRALHKSPDGVATLALAYMQGMRQAGMAAVAKHFPGHGGVVGDSHHVLPEDRREFPQLLDDMRPYSTLISDGLKGVMMAHIVYSSVLGEIASLSNYWINDVLRGQLGFQGAVFSDDLSMAGAESAGSPIDRSLVALQAGADMILVCNDRPAVEAVVDGVKHQPNVVAAARLAAMHPVPGAYEQCSYGSDVWQTAQQELLAAIEPPPLELDGDA
ncbi:MAG: beta-N-acetylhexosaminidase [Gammaproteobacteria bacterium]|nr:beta-N-acetylhexosaminidase [Gammaproteobacteria bacterium]NND54749.1 beta-N-acetylhexosaminidase [Gammaproteobacteria bacterium]